MVPVNNALLIVLGNQIGLVVLADLSWYSDVGVAYLVINDWDEIKASNLGDNSEGLWVLPGLIDKLGTSIAESIWLRYNWYAFIYLRWSKSTKLLWCNVTCVRELVVNLFGKNFCSHNVDSLWTEKLEWL